MISLSCSCVYRQTPPYLQPLNTDIAASLRTVSFVPGKESFYIFSEFNPLNTDTPLIRALSIDPFNVRINGV